MGCCLSCRSSCSTPFDTIRLVHLDGYVEDLNHPISVSEVIGEPPKQFLCTAAQLVSTCAGSKPLNPETQLQRGHIYFVLPLSTTLQDYVSPLDMASLVKRLTATAKSVSPKIISSSSRIKEMPCRARRRSWKPILETIREISFTRRSESDLREIHCITVK
ncbi:hypothetical protein CCACVL1_23052 [Corchorus capsularis]|uniref:DUF4228 domain-containing protein n=1 Tax=Corchorus capsularis TaxID=210143 RepID=A0A1R3GVE2_COCAP|nr:hypothetical protein CCACVL1_23052 [Corchorus capsularis]